MFSCILKKCVSFLNIERVSGRIFDLLSTFEKKRRIKNRKYTVLKFIFQFFYRFRKNKQNC